MAKQSKMVRSEDPVSYGPTPAACSPAERALEDATIQEALDLLDARLRSTRAGPGDGLPTPDATRQYLKLQLADKPYELFACLLLDNRHRVIAFKVLFRGTIDGCSVHPREVVKEALDANAAAVIFAHNHPSGMTEPSQADIRITTRLKEALALIEITTLDHLIVGMDETVSLAERGLL